MRVEITDLVCHRAGRTVLSGLDLTVDTGEVALLRGPNGVGKSTLLRILAGLMPADGGRIALGGQDVTRDPSARQDAVALTGHLDAMKPALTLGENLTLWARLFGSTGDGVGAALDRFGLGDLAGRPAGQCSAGQKRRAGLARLLVIDRPIWLLDEPTVSLDAQSAALIAELVSDHAARGGTALIATHIDLALAPGPVLHMVPPAATAGSADAFLDGDWR